MHTSMDVRGGTESAGLLALGEGQLPMAGQPLQCKLTAFASVFRSNSLTYRSISS